MYSSRLEQIEMEERKNGPSSLMGAVWKQQYWKHTHIHTQILQRVQIAELGYEYAVRPQNHS